VTIPQGIWTSNANLITPATISGTAPCYANVSSSGVTFGNTVASCAGFEYFALTSDFVTTYTMPSKPTYNPSQTLFSMPYTPPIGTGKIKFRIFLSLGYATAGSSYGAVACLYNVAVSGSAPIATFAGSTAQSASGLYSDSYQFAFDYLLPSPVPSAYYLCVGQTLGGSTLTFISNSPSSSYFGGTSGSYVAITNSA
jgi:hypothetical protein